MWAVLTILASLVVGFLCAGCSPTSSNRERKVEVQLTVINRAADAIDAQIEQARGTNNAALVIITAAATRPTVPAETRSDLSHAKDQMAATDTTLAAVPGNTRVIRGTAAEQATTAKDAIKGEETAKTDLKGERDHWLGYKTRVLLWSLLIILPFIALVVFAVKVAGGGPILEVIGELVASFFRLLGRVVRGILTPILHLGSLGAAKLADKVNLKWEQSQQGSKPQPPARTVAVVANETSPIKV